MVQPKHAYQPGQRVIVTQQIPQRDRVWTSRIEGLLLRYEQATTGASYAHSRAGRLWLDRLLVEKDDGERVWLILDTWSHVKILPAAVPAAEDNPPGSESNAARA